MHKDTTLSLQALRRLPGYYNYLLELRRRGESSVAAPAIARAMGLNEVQVRKDLAAVSSIPGKPRVGFGVADLIDSIGRCLGYHNSEDAVLVGAGRMGRALLSYGGFEAHGVRIVAAFDEDEQVIGQSEGDHPILSVKRLPDICRRMNIHLGIITVPADRAQEACDLLVEGGVLAIWNFAPIHLQVPQGVLLQNENLPAQLALLARRLGERIAKFGEESAGAEEDLRTPSPEDQGETEPQKAPREEFHHG